MDNGEKISNARRDIGLTQEEFARVFDVSPRTVIRWENGHSTPQGAAAKKMIRLLQLLENPEARSELAELAIDQQRCEQIKAMLLPEMSLPSVNCMNLISIPPSSAKSEPKLEKAEYLSPILPKIASIVAGATTVYGAYKMLAHAFHDDKKLFTSSNKEEKNRYQCPVCQSTDTSQLLHCTGMVAPSLPCTFVVCRRCVYSSRQAHAKTSPTCDCLDIPAFEPVEIKK